MPYETLHDLVTRERDEILRRWVEVARCVPELDKLSQGELWDHLPLFLDDLASSLGALAPRQREVAPGAAESFRPSLHGRQRLRDGFDIDQVVREYGALGDVILALAGARGYLPSLDESRVLLRALNQGASLAVAAYTKRRDQEQRKQSAKHLAFVAHEVRNRIASASSAVLLLTRADPAQPGRAIEILNRSVRQLGEIVDNVLSAERLESEPELQTEPLSVPELVAEVRTDAVPTAEHRGIGVAISHTGTVELVGDRRLVYSAISNLVRNAVKFTAPGGTVSVRSRLEGGEVVIEVEDQCGGLPPGKAEELFKPFVQRGSDRTGFGLGLPIAQHAILAHGGSLAVQDLPSRGCVFTIRLPLEPPSSARVLDD